MNPYVPVLIFLIFASVLGLAISLAANILGPKKSAPGKADPYECGVPLVTSAREKMSVRFYLTAILFILFDIETIFLYLWATTFRSLGWFGVAEVFVFIGILLIGYVYIIKRRALDWE